MKRFQYFFLITCLFLQLSFIGSKNTAFAAGEITVNAEPAVTVSMEVYSANLAAGRLPTTSAAFNNVANMTDGVKTASNYSDSNPNNGLQWVQLDLGSSYNVNQIKLWHYFGDERKYHDVIVQVSNDSRFTTGVTTVFNDDTDNSVGIGVGTEDEYIETSEGKCIAFAAVSARYVRLYSNGSTANTSNHYGEIEIYDGVTVSLPPEPPPPPPPQITSANLAAGRMPITSAAFNNISNMTDGNKSVGNYSDSYPNNGLQWVQLDLGSSYNINYIKLWHYFGDERKYHDIIVQVSNDSGFNAAVATVFNNDADNSAGMGIGADSEYAETSDGKNIVFNAVNARYVRFYSNGSTSNTSNHYSEIEIYDGVTASVPPEPPPPEITSANLAAGRLPVTSTAFNNVSYVTDGIKSVSNYSDSNPNNGLQWLQLDLGSSYNINYIKLWHYFGDGRKYHDVILRVSNDPKFVTGVTTVFNNDKDNSAGTGFGTDSEYDETSDGKSIVFDAVNARYVRLYSNGSTANTSNHYGEIEIYDGVTASIPPEPPPPPPPEITSANLAAGRLPTTSAALTYAPRMTDGIKSISNYSDSNPNNGLQWVQLDLGSSYNINFIKLWHYFGDERKYHDVIVQVSNDLKFTTGITTVFNNDTDNSAGMGIGTDSEYAETADGKSIVFDAVNARYVRFYSNGSTANASSHYSEIEIYDGVTTSLPPPSTAKPLNHAVDYLDIATYDGSDMSTHPSIKYFPDGWNGHKYWMALTPYTGRSDRMENPCIYVSEDGKDWSVPNGLSNPLAPAPGIGHNCDTEIFYNAASDELWIYYVESDDISGGYVKLMKSSDGVHWSNPEAVISDFRQKYSTLSPTVEYMESMHKYYMWSVNTQKDGYQNQSNFVERRESEDGINWSEPVRVTRFVQTDCQIWHIFIRYIPSKNEYWAVYAAYPNNSSSNNTMLYFANSADGLDWTTYNRAALDKGESGTWDSRQIYRSCFVYDAKSDKLKVWYCGIEDPAYIWEIGYTENKFTDFINSLIN